MARKSDVIKVDLQELACLILEDLPISVDEEGIMEIIGDFDFMTDLIDEYLAPRTPTMMIIKTGALKHLIEELLYFIQKEVFERITKAMNKLDKEEKTILINKDKEYECELDGY